MRHACLLGPVWISMPSAVVKRANAGGLSTKRTMFVASIKQHQDIVFHSDNVAVNFRVQKVVKHRAFSLQCAN